MPTVNKMFSHEKYVTSAELKLDFMGELFYGQKWAGFMFWISINWNCFTAVSRDLQGDYIWKELQMLV